MEREEKGEREREGEREKDSEKERSEFQVIILDTKYWVRKTF